MSISKTVYISCLIIRIARFKRNMIELQQTIEQLENELTELTKQ